jgi:8-oxo-dGTP pyrophosphatase MutT (NUDIX family)
VSEAAAEQDLRSWIGRHLDPLEDQPPRTGLIHAGSDSAGLPPLPEGQAFTPAAVLIALVERAQGYSVILTRRSDNLRRHTGQVALPGGRCDPGESAAQTALREAQEEIGLDPAFVTLTGLSTPCQTGTGYLITPVVGFVRPGFTLTPNPHEVADIFETPFGFLMDPANHEEHERDFGSGSRRFYAMTHENRFIWGATATILLALYSRLYGAAVG